MAEAAVGEPARATWAGVGDAGLAAADADVAAVDGRARTADRGRSVDLETEALTDGAGGLATAFAAV